MPRIIITITDEMDAKLRRVSEETGAPLAMLARRGIEKLLAEHDLEVKSKVVWGRQYSSPTTTDDTQAQDTVPVATQQ